jgi:hypothetical protein
MNLKWYEGREVTEQEEKAIWEAIFPHSTDDMSDSDIQYEIDHDVISLSTCRNGRDVVWAQISDTKTRAVYVDTLEELSNEEIEKELC